MSVLMTGESCMKCACCHFTDLEKTTLWCVKNDMHPRGNDHCKHYKEQKHEKLILTDQFIAVLRLIKSIG